MSPKNFSLFYFLYLFANANGKHTVKSPNDGTKNDPYKVALPSLHRMTLEDFYWRMSSSFPRETFSGMGTWKTLDCPGSTLKQVFSEHERPGRTGPFQSGVIC